MTFSMLGFVSNSVQTSLMLAFSMTSLSISSTFYYKFFMILSNSSRLTFLSMNSIAASNFFSKSIISSRDAFFWINFLRSSWEILLFNALCISVRFAFLLIRLNISFSWESVYLFISSLYSKNLLKISDWQAFKAL